MVTSKTIAESVRKRTDHNSQKLIIKKILKNMGYSEEQIASLLYSREKKCTF